MSCKKQCYIYMNCFGKVLLEYLSAIPEFASVYTMKIFYMMDSVTDVEMDVLEQCDLFLYQHISLTALTSNTKNDVRTNLDLSLYTTDFIICSVLPITCQKISVPSVYFSGYFYDSVAQTNLPVQIKSSRTSCGKLCADYFPNYCFNAKLLNLAMNPDISIEQIVTTLTNPQLYSKYDVLKNVETTLNNIKQRESHNKVDICLTEFIQTNFCKTRLFHTTNHPTVVIFEYVINEILKLIGLEFIRVTLTEDLMARTARVPILPTVKIALGISENDENFNGPYYIHNQQIDTLQEYIEYYVNLLRPC